MLRDPFLGSVTKDRSADVRTEVDRLGSELPSEYIPIGLDSGTTLTRRDFMKVWRILIFETDTHCRHVQDQNDAPGGRRLLIPASSAIIEESKQAQSYIPYAYRIDDETSDSR